MYFEIIHVRVVDANRVELRDEFIIVIKLPISA
jgi:hypothetical protein